MGRKLDALLGRRFRTSKLKTMVKLAISRLAILKSNRHARFNIAHSDLIQLLRLHHHQQALLRVEQVIKDQNMLVVYDMIHEYCQILNQKVNLIEQAVDCPEELKEVVSSLLYAAPRCGEFPELKEIRAILTARFGKELVNGATESRRNSGVSQKMIQKLSLKELSLESKMSMLTEIAREVGIVLQLETTVLPEKVEKVLSLSESMKKYRDVEHAAQDAFESAAYAAAAAKVAVELNRLESFNSNSPASPDSQLKNVLASEPVKSKPHMSDSESDYEEIIEDDDEDESLTYNMKVEEFDDLYSDDCSEDDNIKSFEKMDFDESKYKTEKEKTRFPSRTVYFSSYKQFPFKHQTNHEDGLGR